MTKEERKKYNKEYYEKHREENKQKINEFNKKYYEENKEKIKQYREDNKDKIKELKKKRYKENKEYYENYYKNNKEKVKNLNKEYYKNNKEKVKKLKEGHYKENKEKYVLSAKKWREKNKNWSPKDIKQIRKISYQKRIVNDPLFKIKKNIRSLISNSIRNKGYKKNTKTEHILDCTFEEFKEHIEKQFESWMNWDNYGNPKDKIFEPNKTWDIDHIIPVSNGLTEQELIKLNHYTNLKPLCSYYNRWIKRDN